MMSNLIINDETHSTPQQIIGGDSENNGTTNKKGSNESNEPLPSLLDMPSPSELLFLKDKKPLLAKPDKKKKVQPMVEKVNEKIRRAEKKLSEDPYDIDAWAVLIKDIQVNNKKMEDARDSYERLVTQFPTSGKFWKIYIEAEMKSKNYEKVEKLFHRSLIKVLHIDLWKCYLIYVKETKANLPNFKEKLAQAYDFALDKIGMDVNSYSIWCDYINFLKSVEAVGSYAENQKITAVRKVYQRGVVTPMINVDQLWKDYSAYENGINQLIAKKLIDEKTKEYLNARRVTKEYEAVTRGLNKSTPSVPPTHTPDEMIQVELWKKYIQWEKDNPLRTEDQIHLTKRVMFAFEQCLLCLGHNPNVWYGAAQYLEYSSKILAEKGDMNSSKMFADDSSSVYEKAISTHLNKCPLLYFAYADYQESLKKHEEVHKIYQRVLDIKDIDPTLAYIQYMKFARRAEGIKAARLVFKKAREDTRSQYRVYIAAALMEYYCSKDTNVAFKIFELGLKKYPDIPEYCLAYINYLSSLNEDNNTRVLFERVLSSGSLTTEKTSEIWKKFLEFESTCGDLPSILKVEKRRLQSFNEQFQYKQTALLVDRYKYMDLYPCSTNELKTIGYADVCRTSSQTVSVTSTIVPVVKTSIEVAIEEETSPKSIYPRPDLDQVIPFRPRLLPAPGPYPVPGGDFPFPPAAAWVMRFLPPPVCFHGPFVQVDELTRIFDEWDVPRYIEKREEAKAEFAKTLKNGEVAGTDSPAPGGDGKSRKRPATGDSDDEEGTGPPIHDIYRSRQQKRVK